MPEVKKKFHKKVAFEYSDLDREMLEIKQAITGMPAEEILRQDNFGQTSNKSKKRTIKRKQGPGPSVNYFDEKTQAAIVEYQTAEDIEKKKKIYVSEILPAFDALVENLINVYGFNVMHETKQDLKNECLQFLYTAVEKFNPAKGSKAFSYFSVVAKNWLTIRSKQNAKKTKLYISIDNKEDISKEDLETIENYQVMPSWDDVLSAGDALEQLNNIILEVEARVKTENEIICVKAIKNLIENIEEVDLLSKRAILLYIREMTNLNSKQLSTVLSSLKRHYKEIKRSSEF
jgi:hypothetical protein